MILALLGLSASAGELGAALEDPAGWEVMQDEQHPQWGRVIARHKTIEGVDCLEISGTTAIPAPAMKALILDIPGNLEWSSADLLASEVLRSDAAGFDYFQHLDVPAPFADRYWFLRGQVREGAEGPGSWAFHWERVDGSSAYPERVAALLAAYPGAAEVGVNTGSWALIPEGERTRARFRSCTDVGGNIPRWAGEKAARLLLPNNLRDLFQAAGG